MGAPLAPVPGVLRVFIEGFVDNLDLYKWGNVLHFGYVGGPPDNAACASIADSIAAQWGVQMSPQQPSPSTVQSITVTDLTSDTAGEGKNITVIPGTRGDDSIPANAAVLVSYPSGLRYKGGHPRSYLFCLGNADLTGAAEWNPASLAAVQTAWQNLLNDITSIVVGPTSVTSFGFVRYRGKYLPNSGPPHYYLDTPLYQTIPISSALCRQEMASQRRRIGRRKA
jgi:hypothetical protein